jgi:hypothetical protein
MTTNSLAWQYDIWQRMELRGKWYYCHNMTTVAITWSLATNKITWQMILLPWHNDRGNNVWSLATNKIMWQMVYLQRRCSWQMSLLLRYWSLHVPPLATKTCVASAYIATTVNVATTSYCHAWQRTGMVAGNPNSCNVKLATVAIPYCNVTFCNHWQRTWFSCNIYLLQPNWAYCNVFSSLRKG